MKKKILTAMTLVLLSTAFTARAAEGFETHYISGSFTDFSAVPPSQPGFYLATYYMGYDNGEISASRQLPLGGVFAAGVTANVQSVVPMGIYAYPYNLSDVTFSSGIVVPYVWEDVRVSATFNRDGTPRTGAIEQSVNGLSDIELMPIMASWTNGDITLGGIMNMYAPTGSYDNGRLANPGMGYWTFDPMLSFSWLSSKIGTEFTVFTGVSFNTENTTTSYTSGDVFHLDATLAQHLPLGGGFVGVGASGFYVKQFTGDSGSGARLGSFELESAGVGPTVSYAHTFGKSALVVDLSWLPQLHTVNTTKGNYFWARVAYKF